MCSIPIDSGTVSFLALQVGRREIKFAELVFGTSLHLTRAFVRATGKEVDFYSLAVFSNAFQVGGPIESCVYVDRGPA